LKPIPDRNAELAWMSSGSPTASDRSMTALSTRSQTASSRGSLPCRLTRSTGCGGLWAVFVPDTELSSSESKPPWNRAIWERRCLEGVVGTEPWTGLRCSPSSLRSGLLSRCPSGSGSSRQA